jgi:hypothetical protein
MIRNLPYSPPNYIIALVYISLGSLLAWQASKKMAGQGAALCLMTVFLGAMLLLFKHGFVRADLSHMRLFYGSVTPFCAILAIVSFTGFKTRVMSKKVLLSSAALGLFILYGLMLKFLPGETGPAKLPKNWLTCGNRIVAGIKGQSPEEFPAKRTVVRNSQPQLFSYLNEYGRTFASKGRRPRITFYPWEMLLFEGTEGYDLAPSPSLQLYSTGPHSRAHRLEAGFLSSSQRPDIVVLGPAAIDDRSPVSELTVLLPTLYAHYRVIAVIEGFSILEAGEAGKSPDTVIRYTETPQGMPGEFIRIDFDRPEAVNRLIWRLAAILFKSPELYVVVTMANDNGDKMEYAWRGYLSQLQGGVFFSPAGVADYLRASFRTPANIPKFLPRTAATITSAVAELRRSGGFWNLPVFPRVVPLKVRYCSFL